MTAFLLLSFFQNLQHSVENSIEQVKKALNVFCILLIVIYRWVGVLHNAQVTKKEFILHASVLFSSAVLRRKTTFRSFINVPPFPTFYFSDWEIRRACRRRGINVSKYHFPREKRR